MGISEAELEPINIKEAIPEAAKAPLPPYNGFGSLEDSIQSCISLVPKAPRKDLYKLMNKDRVVLRFKCRFVETSSLALSDADRQAPPNLKRDQSLRFAWFGHDQS